MARAPSVGGGSSGVRRQVVIDGDYLDALEAQYRARPPAGAFTVYEAMSRTGLKRAAARVHLSEQVRARRLSCGSFKTGGVYMTYYWKAKP